MFSKLVTARICRDFCRTQCLHTEQVPVFQVEASKHHRDFFHAVSKLADGFVVSLHVVPAVLRRKNPNQYGGIPGS